MPNQYWILLFVEKTTEDTRDDFEDLVNRKNPRKHVKMYGLISFTVILNQ